LRKIPLKRDFAFLLQAFGGTSTDTRFNGFLGAEAERRRGKGGVCLRKLEPLVRKIQNSTKPAQFDNPDPRLSVACPSKLLFSRAALARGQPGSNWAQANAF
jgi:hypothetical protein